MIGKLVSFVAALAAMAAAAAVLVVSASFAIYALIRTYLGPSGAAACVTLAAAILLAALAFFLMSRLKGSKSKAKVKDEPESLLERLTGLASDRPVVAAGAALAAGLLAWRNPTLVSTLMRMMEPRAEKKRG